MTRPISKAAFASAVKLPPGYPADKPIQKSPPLTHFFCVTAIRAVGLALLFATVLYIFNFRGIFTLLLVQREPISTGLILFALLTVKCVFLLLVAEILFGQPDMPAHRR